MPVPLLGAVARYALKQLVEDLVEDVAKDAFREAASAAQISASVELDLAALGRLRGKHRVAVIRASNRAAKPVRAAVVAQAEAIARFGYTAKSIGTKTRLYPSKSIVVVIGPKMSFVRTKGKFRRGPHKGEPRRQRPYLYSWLIEKGTKRSRKRPFLRPAWDRQGPGFPRRLAAEIAAELAP